MTISRWPLRLSVLTALLLNGCGDDSMPMQDASTDTIATDVGEDTSTTDVETDVGGDVEEEDAGEDVPDAAVPTDFVFGPLDDEEAPAGQVPVTVVWSHGRIVTSCDGMQSIARDNIYSPDASDHHEHAAKGGTYADGVFVFSTGHGYPGHVFRSTDGMDFEQLDGERFHYADDTTGPLSGGTDGIFHDGTDFVLMRGAAPRLRSSDGLDWYEFGEQLDRRYFHHRGYLYVPELGRVFKEGENVDKSERWLIVSEDGGETFRELERDTIGFDASCRVPKVYAHGALVSLGENLLCVSFDGGESWETREAPDAFGTAIAMDDGFAFTRGYRRDVHFLSAAGWDSLIFDNGWRNQSGAGSPWGWFVLSAQSAGGFARSSDGETYERVGENTGGNWFMFGYADQSACPGE